MANEGENKNMPIKMDTLIEQALAQHREEIYDHLREIFSQVSLGSSSTSSLTRTLFNRVIPFRVQMSLDTPS